MGKKELVDAVAASTSITKKDVTAVIESVIAEIVKSVKNDEKVQLTGFGVFSLVDKAAREGRNPSNGQKIQIPAKKGLKFKASKGIIS